MYGMMAMQHYFRFNTTIEHLLLGSINVSNTQDYQSVPSIDAHQISPQTFNFIMALRNCNQIVVLLCSTIATDFNFFMNLDQWTTYFDILLIGIIAASAAFFFGTFILEGAKILMFYWTVRIQQNPLTYGQTDGKNQDLSPLFASLMIPSNLDQVKQRRLKYHFWGMLTHLFNVFLAYIIMLAVMQYNWWIFIAVLLGSGFGHFCFGALSYTIREKYGNLSVFRDTDSSHINTTYEEEAQVS